MVLGCALPASACGSAGPAITATTQGRAALEYVLCLRSHGVPGFPDPDPDGRLPNIPSDIDTTAPAFQSAQSGCARLMPGGTGARVSSTSARLGLLAVAECMRKHGLANFPDPTVSPPPAPPAGSRTGNVMGGPGGYLALPPSSPALSRAAAACGFGNR